MSLDDTAVVAVVAVVAVAPRGPREIVRLAAWAIASALITVAVIQVVVVPLTAALPEMLATNRLVAARTNSPTALAEMYVRSGYHVLKTIAKGHALLLVAAVVAVATRSRAGRLCAGVLAVVGLAVSAWRLAADQNAELLNLVLDHPTNSPCDCPTLRMGEAGPHQPEP